MDQHLDSNRNNWNERVDAHLKSKLYNMDAWRAGTTSLKNIELGLLGDVTGQDLLHLQCHFGQDTLSLARMGARVTGLDLSDKAIATARQLSEELKLPATFVEADVLKMASHVEGDFDTIFTSYGVTGWLPELKSWGQQIADLLRPGGRFILVEFHPFIWMFDDDVQKIDYSYFNVGPSIESADGTYTEGGEDIKSEYYYWNHSLGDVYQSLVDAGLVITKFSEYDYSPYEVFPRPVASELGFQIKGMEGMIPLVFSMIAEKPN